MFEQELSRFWESGKMFRESAMLIEQDGIVSCNLRYRPIKLIRIENSAHSEVYAEDDFVLRGKRIVSKSGRMPFLTENNLRGEDLSPEMKREAERYNIKNCLYTDSAFIVARHICVTYEFDPSFCEYSVPESAEAYLPRTFEKLRKGDGLDLTLFGDSISCGLSSSKRMDIPPYLPPWHELFAGGLKERFNCDLLALFSNAGTGTE